VSVNFATSDGSARAVDDYAAKSGTLTFAPGDTSETVSVSVKGDRKYESSEVFGLNVSGASGAFVVDGQGMGLIRNDDRQ
jgi:hypothetical protein